jgi:hypothetical protein
MTPTTIDALLFQRRRGGFKVMDVVSFSQNSMDFVSSLVISLAGL